MFYRSGLWLFLVACAAAFENYEDTRPVDFAGDDSYHDGTYIDSGEQMVEMREDPIKDLMIFKLITALQNENSEDLDMHYRPKPSSKDIDPYSWQKPSSGSIDLYSWSQRSNEDLKDIMKRPAPVIRVPVRDVKQKPVTRKQPNWKKKGKIMRPQMVCYFKLCAFRSSY
ncbi:uncharacterized protein LOC142978004 [Anticarsia gemmatalis]|uniref:uncharacterized protein LOC142978004 n=1 Tax=Anticarsia gemmatalis TaxID=129554 RepID=UPI003F758B92